MKEKKPTPIASRLMEFIDKKGGPSVVARKMGMRQPTIFYQFRDGRSSPSSRTLERMAAVFPDFDEGYVISGEVTTEAAGPRQAGPQPRLTPMFDPDYAHEELYRLKTENERLRVQLEGVERLLLEKDERISDLKRSSGPRSKPGKRSQADFRRGVAKTTNPVRAVA